MQSAQVWYNGANINWLRIATTATRATTITTTTTSTSLFLAFINTCPLLLFVDHDMHFFNVVFSNSQLSSGQSSCCYNFNTLARNSLWRQSVLQIQNLSLGGFKDGKYFASNLTGVDATRCLEQSEGFQCKKHLVLSPLMISETL